MRLASYSCSLKILNLSYLYAMPHIPQQLLNDLSQLPHFDATAFTEAHREENKITSVRLNAFKKVDTGFETGRPVPWATNAFYLEERPSFTFDPLFHAGCYYVQEAGSMFIELALKSALDLSAPLNVLDLCAAPGGKSTLINSLINHQSLLVANEFVKSRAAVLAYNLSKWGTHNTIVTNSDPQRFSALGGIFDAMVVDAPCSGSGLFRKQPEAINEWSEDAVNQCSIRQRKILADALPCLKENGVLIYSTCSYSVQENEEIVAWLIAEQDLEFVQLPVHADWGIVDTGAGYRFYPHLTQSEGFFCAVLRKKNVENTANTRKKAAAVAAKAELTVLQPFITAAANEAVLKINNQFHLLNAAAQHFITGFEKQLYFKKAGVLMGEIKGSDLVPHHELALATALSAATSRLELDTDNALKFLRKENFALPAGSRGLHLITYRGFGIGWAKLLPNRANNYLPNELRILSRG